MNYVKCLLLCKIFTKNEEKEVEGNPMFVKAYFCKFSKCANANEKLVEFMKSK